MSHTNEPWKVVNRGDEECSDIDAPGPDGWNGDVTVAMNIGNDTARRIVACVNSCVGISTENLEDNVPVKELARRYNALIKALRLLSGIKLGMVANGIVDKALKEASQ